MNYQTRQLTALREIKHGNRLVAIGERFDASHLDANYYLTRNMAANVEQPKEIERLSVGVVPPTAGVEPFNAYQAVQQAVQRRGRPTNAARALAAEMPKLDESPE